jgi:hypothetical protein
LRRAVICAVIGVAVALALDGPAFASSGVEHLHFAAGPYLVKPGANLILTDTHGVPKPDQNGFMTRVEPNLHYARANGRCCGRIPRVDIIHLHHGVWLTDGAAGRREGNDQAGLYPFMASGEEKTVYQLPRGYGYPVGAADHWILNYMIHNLRRRPAKVYITYDMDFIPGSSPTARGITSVHPIWMDVEDHNLYPVFNVYRHSGRYGRFTFPDMANNPYKGGPPLNLFTVDHPGTPVATAGHLHPGGLHDDLELIRAGATDTSKTPRGILRNSVRLFRSSADYFDKRGPISWDMAHDRNPSELATARQRRRRAADQHDV